jgi:hypothetical protein
LKSADIDIYDMYSCFPIVPKLACHHLGLSITKPEKPITVLGGLTSFGGAGNNYSMHVRLITYVSIERMLTWKAITEMARQLRAGSARNGLILANGGFLSYQHAICISNRPRRDGSQYPDSSIFNTTIPDPIPPMDLEAEGKSQIEVSTSCFNLNFGLALVLILTLNRHIPLNSVVMGVRLLRILWAVCQGVTIDFWPTMVMRKLSIDSPLGAKNRLGR